MSGRAVSPRIGRLSLVALLLVAFLSPPQPAEAFHITCTLWHAPIATYLGNEQFMISGRAEISCNGFTDSYVEVRLIVSSPTWCSPEFPVEQAFASNACDQRSVCGATALANGRYGRTHCMHTVAGGLWDDGHGNTRQESHPVKCTPVDPGMRLEARSKGPGLAAVALPPPDAAIGPVTRCTGKFRV
jgi:hypothetical protein